MCVKVAGGGGGHKVFCHLSWGRGVGKISGETGGGGGS